MSDGTGIAAIQARVASIQARFVGTSDETSSTSIPDPHNPGFEPFGDAYQRAVEDLRGSALGGVVATGFASRTAAGPHPATGTVPATSSVTARPATSSSMIGANLAERTGGAPTLPVGTTWTSDGIRILPPSSQTIVTPMPAPATTSPAVGQIGGFGRMPVPAELEPFGNGRIPRADLAEIGQGSHRLHAPAAASWRAVVAAAAADGIELRITDSYRSYEQQVDLANRKGLYRNGGLAAVPGTSNHGWGLAVDADVTDPNTLEWLRQNGPRFGWVEAVPREPWHWEYRPHQV